MEQVAGATQNSADSTKTVGTELNNSSTANNEGTIELDLGDGNKISVNPKDVQEWKNAFEKKKTNADAFFTKKSQELSAEKAAAAKERAELNELMKQLRGQGQQTTKKIDNLIGYEGDDEETLRALAIMEKVAEKYFETKINPELKTVKEQLSAREQNDKAAVVRGTAEKILAESQLDDWSKGTFVSAFAGRYDVDSIPMEDSYDELGNTRPGLVNLFKTELKNFEKGLNERGLKSNQQYIDNKTNANKKLGTDAKGTSGKESDDVDWKSLKGRDKRNMKLKLLTESVNRQLSGTK